MMRNLNLLITAALLLPGCYSEQGISHKDLKGTIRLPKEASQVTMADGDETWEIDDPRAIGPVYIGVFSGLDPNLEDYVHPEIGPITEAGINTYPYGGTTVGRFDWACYEALKCQVITGRFRDYDDILDFFANELRQPILNN